MFCVTTTPHPRGRPHSSVATGSFAKTALPGLLSGRSLAVTVRASDDALLDLRKDRFPAPSTDHLADRHDLAVLVDVIELENGQVGLAAVDAWMLTQVFMEHQQNVLLLQVRLRDRSPHVVGLVPFVVSAPVCRLTLAAVIRMRARANVAEWELPDRLELAAARAFPESMRVRAEQRALLRTFDQRVSAGTSRPYDSRIDRDSDRARPPELRGRLSAVAVGASNVALLDLPKDPSPLGDPRKLTNSKVLLLWITMIELEDRDIRTAAFDAGVLAQIFVDECTYARAFRSATTFCLREVRRFVLSVVLSAVRAAAVAAPHPAEAALPILDREVLYRFHFTATRATTTIDRDDRVVARTLEQLRHSAASGRMRLILISNAYSIGPALRREHPNSRPTLWLRSDRIGSAAVASSARSASVTFGSAARSSNASGKAARRSDASKCEANAWMNASIASRCSAKLARAVRKIAIASAGSSAAGPRAAFAQSITTGPEPDMITFRGCRSRWSRRSPSPRAGSHAGPGMRCKRSCSSARHAGMSSSVPRSPRSTSCIVGPSARWRMRSRPDTEITSGTG